MKNTMQRRERLWMGALLLALAPAAVWAQDPVKVAPDNYKVVLENEHVRVCDVQLKPGAKITLAAHGHNGLGGQVLDVGLVNLN